MLQVRQLISLVTSHPYLPFCRYIIHTMYFISLEKTFLGFIFVIIFIFVNGIFSYRNVLSTHYLPDIGWLGRIKLASVIIPSTNESIKDLILMHTVQLKPMIKAQIQGRIVSSGITDVVFPSVWKTVNEKRCRDGLTLL